MQVRRLDLPEAHLWLVDLAREPAAGELAWLAAEEWAQARRLAFAADQRRYLVARVELRRRLGLELQCEPGSLVFDRDALGKPRLANHRCEFNLSHSGEAAAVALGHTPIGVDVEQLRDIGDLDALAERCFTAAERLELTAAGESRGEWFLRGWTRKEACLKAIGCGLSLEPATFETGLGPDAADVGLSWDGARHHLRVHSFRDGDTIGAVAVVLAGQTRD